MSEELRDWHPDDPTVWIWKQLIKESTGKRGPMSVDQRRLRSKQRKEYLAQNPGARLDLRVTPPVDHQPKAGPVLGTCGMCGGPLYSKKYVEIGIGVRCLKTGLERGDIKIEKGKYVIRRRKRRNSR
jgi:hypothetical protein